MVLGCKEEFCPSTERPCDTKESYTKHQTSELTVSIKCMSINQKKQKLKNQSSCFQLQEFIDKEIEIVKDQLGEN